MVQRTDIAALLDGNGFLLDQGQWDKDVAVIMAERLGIGPLGPSHWQVVQHVRERYLREGELPVQRQVCRELDLVSDCVCALFGGPLEAWKVAGLPDPGEEARVYMENMEAHDSITGGPRAAAR